jgi:hypothetical protein
MKCKIRGIPLLEFTLQEIVTETDPENANQKKLVLLNLLYVD